MRQQVSEWEFTASNEVDALHESILNDGDFSVDSCQPGVLETNPDWLNASSCSLSTGATEAEDFQDIFEILPDLHLHSTISSSCLIEREILDEGRSSKGKRKADDLTCGGSKSEEIGMVSVDMKTNEDERPKRTRSAEINSLSERRRRDQIRGKMRALQEPVPNCNKSSRASTLDDAIEYLKALKRHCQMTSTGGGALCQVPYMQQTGIQSTQIPQFLPVMQMQPMLGFGMGMMSMSYSTGLNMMPVPAPFYPLSSATAGMHLIPGSQVLPVPQIQVPLIASRAPPANTATSTVPPQFSTEVNCTSQNVPRIATESQQLPILRQKCNAGGSSLTLQASHAVMPSMSEKATSFKHDAGHNCSR